MIRCSINIEYKAFRIIRDTFEDYLHWWGYDCQELMGYFTQIESKLNSISFKHPDGNCMVWSLHRKKWVDYVTVQLDTSYDSITISDFENEFKMRLIPLLKTISSNKGTPIEFRESYILYNSIKIERL